MAAPTLPATMKAWQYTKTSGGIEKNLKINLSAPVPKTTKPSQHIVKVLAMGLNPVDWKPADNPIFDRFIKKPATPGIDYVGRMVTPAAGSSLKPGEMVFGCAGVSVFAGGALAEYAISDKEATVALPSGLDPLYAAGLGVAGETAYQSILANAKPGMHVFLNGGSGGVGVFGIQIAKASGMHVVTTCSTKNVEFCRSLGADEVIDYKRGPVVEQLQQIAKDHKFDLVVDNVGSDMNLYWKAHTYTSPNAPYINIVGEPSLKFLLNKMQAQFWPGFLGGGKRRMQGFFAHPSVPELEQMAKWIQEGKVRPIIDQKFSFEDAPKAIERSKSGRAVGKILVDVALDRESKD